MRLTVIKSKKDVEDFIKNFEQYSYEQGYSSHRFIFTTYSTDVRIQITNEFGWWFLDEKHGSFINESMLDESEVFELVWKNRKYINRLLKQEYKDLEEFKTSIYF